MTIDQAIALATDCLAMALKSQHGLEEKHDNGESFADLADFYALCIDALEASRGN